MAPDKFGKDLRKRIVDDFNQGISQKDLSIKYKVHKSSISRILSRFKKTKSVEVISKGGRPRKTDKRTDALIVREIKKFPFKSAPTLVKELNIPVSARTVSRRLIDADLLAYRPAKKPLISKRNQLKRLQFAQEHISWTVNQWKNVLFSDESKFNIIASDGITRVRRPKGKRVQQEFCVKTVKHGGGHVMAWGCFSANGLGPLHRIQGIMDKWSYKNILEQIMLPYAEWEMPLRWTFQQDNDPKHTSKVVKTWFLQNNINVMQWPPQSPDLNPIENLWSIVKQRIDRNNVKNADEFFNRIKDAWYAIPQVTINNLIESMPRRCKAVIDSKGFATKY